jgi:putative transposase
MLFPIDSTVISLTSKLFWQYGYHQVKLMNGININQGNTTECIIHFDQGHDSRFRGMIQGMISENAVGIMDRGFASWEFLDEPSLTGTPFVVRIKNNMKVKLDHNRYRIVWFYDLETRTEFRLATNLRDLINEEVSEIYRHR